MFRRSEIAESLRTQQVEVPAKNDKNFSKKSNQGKLGLNSSFKTNHDLNSCLFPLASRVYGLLQKKLKKSFN